MAFIDRVQIKLASGHGGKGVVHFKRTRRSPRAGPDGGDGGKGGDLILSPKASLKDLSHLNNRAFYKAEDGKSGEKGKKKGAKGKNLIISVPEGTLCYDSKGQFLKELKKKDWRFLTGGKGGKGNYFFKTARLQAPQTAQPGQPSVQKKLILDLKWLSDVCLIGYRGCGKTSLLFSLGRQKEKLCPSSYPRLFSIQISSSIAPILFVDLPGLSRSTKKFLKQAERTKIIILIISLMEVSPFASYQTLREELLSYDREHNSYLNNKAVLLLLTGKKDPDSIKKVKLFDDISMQKFSFFSENDPVQLKKLMNTIKKLISLPKSNIMDTVSKRANG